MRFARFVFSQGRGKPEEGEILRCAVYLLLFMTITGEAHGDTVKSRRGKEYNGTLTFDGSSFRLDFTYLIMNRQGWESHPTSQKATRWFRASEVESVEFNENTTDDPPTRPLPNGPLDGNGTECKARGKDTLLLADESRQDGLLTKITRKEVEIKVGEGKKDRPSFSRDKITRINLGACTND